MKQPSNSMIPDPSVIAEDIRRALREDVGDGDISAALIPSSLQVEAEIIAREPLLVCGRPWVEGVFKAVHSSITVQWWVEEGSWLPTPGKLCTVRGDARSILTAERTALNFLQTLSATATKTYRYVQQINDLPCKLLDTRKTLPGLRLAQKYAVHCAGGENHRFGLYDAFLIKENHITACGSIEKAVAQAKRLATNKKIIVEVENLVELQQAMAALPDRILLDNFTNDMLKQAVLLNQPKCCDLEASGGASLETLRAIAVTGVDYISVGDLTKSVQAIDLSLLILDLC